VDWHIHLPLGRQYGAIFVFVFIRRYQPHVLWVFQPPPKLWLVWVAFSLLLPTCKPLNSYLNPHYPTVSIVISWLQMIWISRIHMRLSFQKSSSIIVSIWPEARYRLDKEVPENSKQMCLFIIQTGRWSQAGLGERRARAVCTHVLSDEGWSGWIMLWSVSVASVIYWSKNIFEIKG